MKAGGTVQSDAGGNLTGKLMRACPRRAPVEGAVVGDGQGQ